MFFVAQTPIPDSLINRIEPHDAVIIGVLLLSFGMISTCFGVIIWQMRSYLRDRRSYVMQLVELVERVTGVIDKHTAVVEAMLNSSEDLRKEQQEVREAMASRPCALLQDSNLRDAWEQALEKATRPAKRKEGV